MKYHNEQKKCKEAIINSKGFCKWGKFYNQTCECKLHKPCWCPYAWKYYDKNNK